MPKTDVNNPADWLAIVAADLEGIGVCTEREVAYAMCHAKLAEVLEKTLKAELIRLGWPLEKTHDLRKLGGYLQERGSDLLPQIRPLCDALAEVYFSDRYVGYDTEDPDWPTLRAQLAAITALAEKIRARIASPLP